jgi:hypothetical protein
VADAVGAQRSRRSGRRSVEEQERMTRVVAGSEKSWVRRRGTSSMYSRTPLITTTAAGPRKRDPVEVDDERLVVAGHAVHR